MRRDDWLVQQLPVGMVDDEFLVRFVSIFQEMAESVLVQVDNLPHVFDTAVTPDAMVRAIGGWIGVDWIDPSLPDMLQRRIVREYARLLPWRGTKRGLTQLLSLLSGGAVSVEDSGGVYLEGEAPRHAPHVRLEVESVSWTTEADLVRIIRDELPANATFELRVAGRVVHPVAEPAVTAVPASMQGSVPEYRPETADVSADMRGGQDEEGDL